MTSNYPDDIRQHDDNPNSPFYDDWREEWVASRATEIKREILSDSGYKRNGAKYGISDVVERIYEVDKLTELFEGKLLELVSHGRPFGLTTVLGGVAIKLATQLAADELADKENNYE